MTPGIGGRYRFFRPPEVLASPFGTRYVGDMDRLFDTYAELVPVLVDFFRDVHPKDAGDSDFVYRQAIRAKAFDALRGILPAASLSNLGIYGTGQAYEALLLRMRAHPLPEARSYADADADRAAQGHPELPQAGRPRRPGRGVVDLPGLHPDGDGGRGRASCSRRGTSPTTRPRCALLEWDPDAEVRMVTAMLYPYLHLPEEQIERRVRAMSAEERLAGRRRLRR